MSDNFRLRVREKIKEVKEKVIVREETLQKIITLFLSIKEDKFPSKKPPRGILFYGPPGTGKTKLMNVLAEVMDLPEPIIIRGPEIFSQYYGKSEARIRQIFNIAKEKAEEDKLSIIFIDELDSIAVRRDLTKGELEPRLVGQLLSLMDGFDEPEHKKSKGHVIIIGSTNRPSALDPALRRPGRFDLEVEFSPPNAQERSEILRILLKEYIFEKHQSNINFDEISEIMIGFTGADIHHLINESVLKALWDGRDIINQEDIKTSIKNVKPSALREYNSITPKNRENEIGDEHLINRIREITNQFVNDPEQTFKAILLNNSKLSNYISSTIAYSINKKLMHDIPFIIAKANWFKTKWFGEMERSIREFFDKIKVIQPCIIYITNLDAIAPNIDYKNENLFGATLEIYEQILELKQSENIKLLLLCSAKGKIDNDIGELLEKF